MSKNKNVMISYVTGFFDADGSITMTKSYKNAKFKTIKVDFTNVELSILKEIQEYLLEYDIKTFISTKPARKLTHQVSYALSSNSNQMSLKLCQLLINSKHPKKIHRIKTVLKYHNIVTKRNGKYSNKEHDRKLAYERLFYSSSFH